MVIITLFQDLYFLFSDTIKKCVGKYGDTTKIYVQKYVSKYGDTTKIYSKNIYM